MTTCWPTIVNCRIDFYEFRNLCIERFGSKRNSADIIVLMDSNRRYMDFSYLFPEKQGRVMWIC